MNPSKPHTAHSWLAFGAVALAMSGLAGCNREAPLPPRFAPPPAPLPGAPVVYYKFPFLGKWRVLRTHYGARQPDQAFAIDFVPDGRASASPQNSGYPCYNQPIVADASGIVVVAVDGVMENVPGTVNEYDQHGNYVVIDHKNGEFSLMAHMIPGSLKVRPGSPVQPGVELGRCGNTGMSTHPHIHWQVMDNPNAAVARGIQPRLAPYDRSGNTSTDLPEKKDTMENQ